jgi:endonuclease YncB( thermonuclease family)
MFLGQISASVRSLAFAAAIFLIGFIAGSSVGPAASTQGRFPGELGADPRSNVETRTGYAAEVVRIVDGDTFEARVHVWPGLDVTTKVRLRGIDAPESRARCDEERNKAEAARDRLQMILTQGRIAISDVTLDKYGGRVVANASTLATTDVSAALLAAGLARRYDGGRRQAWCGPSDQLPQQAEPVVQQDGL